MCDSYPQAVALLVVTIDIHADTHTPTHTHTRARAHTVRAELSYVEQYIARVQELQQAGGDGTGRSRFVACAVLLKPRSLQWMT